MKSTSALRIPIVLSTAGLALALALTGCSALPHSTNQGGGNTGSGTSADGKMHAELPATYPSADVPLVSDDFAYALTTSDDSWGIIARVDDAASGFTKAGDLLVGAGFQKNSDIGGTANGVSIGLFTSDKYSVQLTASTDKEFGPVVNYAVVRKTQD